MDHRNTDLLTLAGTVTRLHIEAARMASGIDQLRDELFRSVNRHEQVQQGRLSDRAVALVVKRAAAAAGLDAARRAYVPGTGGVPPHGRASRTTWTC